MKKTPAIPILIVLCLCLWVLNLLVLVAAYLLLGLPPFVLLFIVLVLGILALALGILGFVAIVRLFLPGPKVQTRSTSDRPLPSRSEEKPPLRIASPPSFEKPKPIVAERTDPKPIIAEKTEPKPIIAMRTEPKPEPKRVHKITEPVSSKCPHGKTKTHCAICDPVGYKREYGDWETD